MRRCLFHWGLLVWIGGVLIAPPSLYAADEAPRWQAGLAFSHLTGDYGEQDKTDIFYLSATAKRYLHKGDVTLTVPYVDISSPGVTFVGGDVEPIPGGGSGSGLGDIILKGRYYAAEQDGWVPFVDLVGSVKFPTADEDEGLGTGEPDVTAMVELARRLRQDAWTVLAEFGYTFVGEPSGYDVDNRWLYSIGLAFEVDPKLTLSAYLDGRTAIFEGRDDPLSILAACEFKFRPELRLDVLLEAGLSDGSPDLGITIGLRRRL